MSIENNSPLRPPALEARPITRSFHGDDVADPYEWFREAGEDATLAHLTAENAYADAILGQTSDLATAIAKELESRTQLADWSEARRHGDYWWFTRTGEEDQYPRVYRVKAVDAAAAHGAADPLASRPCPAEHIPGEQLVLDYPAMAEGEAFFSPGYGVMPAPDGIHAVVGIDTTGGEEFRLRFFNAQTGEVLDDQISDAVYGGAWCADSRHFIYLKADDAWRACEVWVHEVGADPSTDRKIFEDPNESYGLYLQPSQDGRWAIISCTSTTTTEILAIDLSAPDALTPMCLRPRSHGLDYQVNIGGGQAFIVHNATSEDFEVSMVDLTDALRTGSPLTLGDPSTWRSIFTAGEGERIDSVTPLEHAVVVDLRSGGVPVVAVAPRKGTEIGEFVRIPVDGVVSVESSIGSVYSTGIVEFSVAGPLTPPRECTYTVATGEISVVKQRAVPNFDASAYVAHREWVEVDDGVRMPVDILHKKGVEADGTNPGYLYGYGSYEVSIDPAFSPLYLSLADRGVVCAVAHPRGGGEMGRSWYLNGKLTKKRNTFTDFVAAADYLLDAGWVARGRLAAEGRSAGGLLMGAVANIGTDRFRAIHAGVPFVDALTTILMPDLPLTVGEWEEWGNPIESEEVYHYMKSYSPYENIHEGEYPAILATTSLNDIRVSYVEPTKWVARLRATVANGDDRPIVLRTELVAGHGGTTGRFNKWLEAGRDMSFLLGQIGATELV